MSAGDPSQQNEDLAKQQHELLTPFNHIIGYSDLLLIDPNILTQSDVVADLEVIRAEGLQALENLQTALAVSTRSVDLTYVRPRMVVLLNQILDQVANLQVIASERTLPELAVDLDRMRVAAERFLLLSIPLTHESTINPADYDIIKRLQAAAAALEAGSFEFDPLANASPRDDSLGQLTRTFQRMTNAVRAREEALKLQVQQLQSELQVNLTADRLKQPTPIIETEQASQSIRQKVADLFACPPQSTTADSSPDVMDLLDLSPALNRVLRVVLNRVEITFPELCQVINETPEAEPMTYNEIDEALIILGERGLLICSNTEPIAYKAQIKRKARPTQMRDIWDALSVADKKKPNDETS